MGRATLHVRPRGDGRWSVELEDTRHVLSIHHDCRAAALSAADHAKEVGAEDVIVHDRYMRSRILPRRDRAGTTTTG
jgi:hypothetical protein